ncbi:hypothetical protein LOAG_02155 [Loa loa]|uniref:Uncharacterized protein n=1 Tax=Loa loa TaxID=7209 RepID=A0A1S0U979_LOALO|nr:hypothetical protein LOAG_02155 [Loa loa]EFO26331.1 hypothetical protein LOAG_02155 [Loa loa]
MDIYYLFEADASTILISYQMHIFLLWFIFFLITKKKTLGLTGCCVLTFRDADSNDDSHITTAIMIMIMDGWMVIIVKQEGREISETELENKLKRILVEYYLKAQSREREIMSGEIVFCRFTQIYERFDFKCSECSLPSKMAYQNLEIAYELLPYGWKKNLYMEIYLSL